MEPKLLPARYSLAILFLACAFCCHAQSRVIEVHLEKQKPAVKSTIWAFPLEDDTVPLAELRPRATGLPDEWKAYSVTDDFPQALYQGFCAGKVDEQTCMRKFEAWQRDTTDYSPYPVRIFLMVAFGRDGSGVEHVMFDTDGDYDFSDETDYRLGEQPPLDVYKRQDRGEIVKIRLFRQPFSCHSIMCRTVLLPARITRVRRKVPDLVG